MSYRPRRRPLYIVTFFGCIAVCVLLGVVAGHALGGPHRVTITALICGCAGSLFTAVWGNRPKR